jgi:hypothetical protein
LFSIDLTLILPSIHETPSSQLHKGILRSAPEVEQSLNMPTQAPFRAKRLDLGGFINSKIIRDHTKRKVFEKFEPQRYGTRGNQVSSCSMLTIDDSGKPCDTSYGTHLYPNEYERRHNCSFLKCTATPGRPRYRIDV